jgi:hypothetical protein
VMSSLALRTPLRSPRTHTHGSISKKSISRISKSRLHDLAPIISSIDQLDPGAPNHSL